MFDWLRNKKKKNVPKSIKNKKEFLEYFHDEDNIEGMAKLIDKMLLMLSKKDRGQVVMILSILTANIKMLSDKYDTLSKSDFDFFNSVWNWCAEEQEMDLTTIIINDEERVNYIG